jgi:hypothetical protein
VENKELRTFSESLPVRRPGDFIHRVGADAHLTEEEAGVQDLTVAAAEAVVADQDPAVVVEALQGPAGTDRKQILFKIYERPGNIPGLFFSKWKNQDSSITTFI